jgi:RHS repeat-associated protein
MGCRKLTYYLDSEPKINTLSGELTLKISSQTLRSSYLFGFNGKEKDDELKGEGNSLDFGARIYDSRLGRWLSLDPLMAKYPSMSPYNFCANNPIVFIDIDGRDIYMGNSAAKAFFNEVTLKVFKSSDVFTVDINGYVQIDQKKYDKAYKKWSPEQKEMAEGMKDIVNSKEYHLRLYVGDNKSSVIKEKIVAKKVSLNIKPIMDANKLFKVKQGTLETDIDFQKQIATTTVFDKDPIFDKYGFIVINLDKLKNLDPATQVAEGIKEYSKSGTLFHEMLDEFHSYMKTGKFIDKSLPKSKQVKNYNYGAKEAGDPERTGAKH